ncbi:hypothetical protein M8445_17860 (plasmid) [Deinococcus aquaticus]|uniref:Nucleotidyltransferase n=1 Tax=Deinococcus aquaticus TaxID=328692 RepID=A0ABY7V5Y3_9DEIO|nr:hypothetical protein [Deinococcus aquaticus]WDA60604.1 hypothetical protein M8445_17860 [Deinococcus aquaticus]
MNELGYVLHDFVQEQVNLTRAETEEGREAATDLAWDLWDLGQERLVLPPLTGRPQLFGSFGRKTKVRSLDDIDLLVPLSVDDYWTSAHPFDPYSVDVYLPDQHALRAFLGDEHDAYLLSSAVLLRQLKLAVQSLPGLERAEIKGNGEAVSVWPRGQSWKIDLVPALPVTRPEQATHFLIPNGVRSWWRTQPALDQLRLDQADRRHGGNLRPLIRLLKYWNVRPGHQRIGSYLLESLALSIFEPAPYVSCFEWDLAIEKFMTEAAKLVFHPVPDPKALGPNLDAGLRWDQRLRWADRANRAEYCLNSIRTESWADISDLNLVFGDAVKPYI